MMAYDLKALAVEAVNQHQILYRSVDGKFKIIATINSLNRVHASLSKLEQIIGISFEIC